MNFGWSSEQISLRDAATAFAEREMNGGAETGTVDPAFSRDLWQRCAAFGVQGAYAPKKFGGRDHDIPTTILILEGIGYGCRDNGLTLGLNGHMWAVMEPLLRFGSAAQHEKYLAGLCNGHLVGAHGMTETGSGSDAFSLATTATPIAGGYRLNGQKVYIGLAPVCDLALVFASTAPERGEWGISAFIVEALSVGGL